MNESALVGLIQQFIAEKLGVSAEKIDPRERFRRLGVDSLTATAMLVFLGTRLERSLSPTLAWQFPTPRELARYLAGEAGDASVPAGRTRSADDEPVAIVGISCRLPGAPDKEAFWGLLRDGVDAVGPVPRDRWDADALYDADVSAPAKMSTRFGGFLDDVASFDAAFFGISPREAIQMDPQQRLMLELSWEALEDACMQPPRLKDTRTGVFFGAMWMDYSHAPEATRERIGPHTATGQDLSIIPARVSYTLGLLGPIVQVNTACSSSLVAVHMARQSLLRGESNLALAGAVNLILSPDSMITMSKFGAAAPDGRCKAFDAAANGYVRSEGAGVVVLKRLSDAIADGDHVYCVIRGSAINNDGFSNGLTAPSPKAQEGVLRDAYADAGVAPADVQYVEAHGTGTMLGDPIEAGALGAVLGRAHPPDRPLRIGSVKTNIGHLEPASGMAGLIKVALSMSHRELPASLHFNKPNPHIPFDDLHLRVQAKRETWETDDGRRIAGVGSFGFGGTNAHVVLESTDAPRSVRLAAASAAALQERARSLIGALRASPSALYTLPETPLDACVAPHRLAVTVSSARELIHYLESFLQGSPQPGLLVGTAPSSPPKVVLVFGGQGSQWLGMGRALLRDEPVARAMLERCDAAMRPFVSWSLVERLVADDAAGLDETPFVQPAIFALQVALAEALRARGLRFGAVVGQSMGEVAAAHVAGDLSLEDAARVICVRSEIVAGVRGGRMAVVGLSLDEATRAIAPRADRLSVAVAAGPESTVVAGDEQAVAALQAELEARGVVVRPIRVDYASHSRFMDPLLPELRRRLGAIRPRRGDVPFWSTVTGEPLDGEALGAEYWAKNLREPVLFAPTVSKLADAGQVFVEVDPHPVLAMFVEQCITHARAQGAVIGCAARDEPEPLTLREAAGRLYVAGCSVSAEATPAAASARDRSAELVVLSARTPEAVRAAAGRLRDHVAAHPAAVADIAFSLMTTRSPMECRLAFAVPDREALLESLDGVAGDAFVEAPSAAPDGAPPRIAFVFPGQGSQWLGMGRQLLAEEPAFAEALAECDRAVAAETGWSVIDELKAAAERSAMERIDVVQPLLFAMEVALAALWRSWGVEPHAVVGHSMGEIAAACVTGALSLEDAVAVVCRRSALLKRLSGKGEMALVELTVDDAKAAIAGLEDRLGVAVSNGTRSTVLSGDPAALAQVLAKLEGRGVFCRRIKADVAGHSPQLDPLVGELVSQVASLAPRTGSVPMRSTVTGETIAGPELTAHYWGDNLRQPVRFADAVKALIAEGVTQFIEISPHPVLLSAVDELRKELGSPALAVGSTRCEQPERRSLLESLGALFVHGYTLDAGLLFPSGGRRIPLPTYPWQRKRHWLAPVPKKHASGEAAAHPLLGVRIPIARADALYESTLTPAEPAFAADQRVGGQAIVPGAALAEMVRAAAEDHAGGQPAQARGVAMQVPLVLPERGARALQVVLTNDGTQASIYSRAADASPGVGWTLHATAEVSTVPVTPPAAVDLAALRRRCPEVVDVSAAYAQFAALGLEYGAAFQGLRGLSLGPAEALAEVALPHGLQPDGYGVHPALLDAALQAVIAAAGLDRQGIVLPFEIGRFVVHQQGASSALVHVRLDTQSADGIAADVTLVDPAGAVVAEVTRVRFRRADLASARRSGDASAPDAFYRLDWVAADAPAPSNGAAECWAVVSIGEGGAASRLAKGLRARGARAEPVAMAALKGTAAENIVCVWEPGGEPEAGIRMATEGLAIIKALAGRAQATRLWWVTRGAMAVVPGEDVDPASAAVWGLGRTVVLEQPELRGTLVDIARADDVAGVLAREVAAGNDETQIAWRAATRHVARLVRAQVPTTVPDAPNGWLETKQSASLRVDGTAVIVGGLGGLGLEVARDLAARGMKHLVLTGRRGLTTPGAASAVAELEGTGALVTVAAVDVADRAALAKVLGAIPAELPLRAVIHSAVVLDDGMLAEQTPDRFRRVMAPKVLGAWNLHELTAGADLDAFVLFSSMVGTLGNASQGAYAAANAYLDALAVHRGEHGQPATSLAWGPWAELGLAAGLKAQLQARWTSRGFAMISPAQGMALFDKALTRRQSHLVVVPIDLRAAAKSFGASVPPVWRALIRSTPARAAARDGSWASELAALPAERKVEAVTQVVRSEVARILSLGRAASVPIDRPLRELGLDSLMAVELRNALGRRAGATLPPNLAFDHPTPAAIARFLLSEVPSLVERIGTQGAPLAEQNGSHEPAGSGSAPHLPVKVPPPAVPVPRGERPADRIETIPMGERWLADGFRVIPTPGGFAQRMVDMTQAMEALAALAEAGLRASLTHVLVRAAALALARNPRLHQSVVGYRKLTPGAVDIGLSMAGQTTYAPVVVLPDVDRTPLPALVGIVEESIAAARVKEAVDLQNMRRMGWMTPFAFFRRFVIRALQRSFWFRRKLVGTFQVSGVPTVDAGVPLQFYSGSILSFGRVRASVVAVDGRVDVRPMMQLTICVEATSTDSTRGAALVSEIAAVLESRELVDEACAALGSDGARALPPLVEEPWQPRAELSAAPGE